MQGECQWVGQRGHAQPGRPRQLRPAACPPSPAAGAAAAALAWPWPPRWAWRPVPSRLGMPSQSPSQSAAQPGAPLQVVGSGEGGGIAQRSLGNAGLGMGGQPAVKRLQAVTRPGQPQLGKHAQAAEPAAGRRTELTGRCRLEARGVLGRRPVAQAGTRGNEVLDPAAGVAGAGSSAGLQLPAPRACVDPPLKR